MERHFMLKDWKNKIVKMPILPKATYSFSAVPIKIPTPFSPQIQKKNPKISIELQRSQVGKAILR